MATSLWGPGSGVLKDNGLHRLMFEFLGPLLVELFGKEVEVSCEVVAPFNSSSLESKTGGFLSSKLVYRASPGQVGLQRETL